jgi:DNA ligase 1
MFTLYKKDARGQIRVWTAYADGNAVVTEHGLLGGILQESRKYCEQKNVGKSNETDTYEQAELEVESEVRERLRKGYAYRIEDLNENRISPMLAKVLGGREESRLIYPVDTQPKLDGHRALTWKDEDDLSFKTRGNKDHDIPHIAEILQEFLLPDIGGILDGEIYRHGLPFQTISSLIKRNREDSKLLRYFIYDYIPRTGRRQNTPWLKRKMLLQRWHNTLPAECKTVIRLTPTKTVLNSDELRAEQAKWVGKNYEGLMVRTHEGIYRAGARSAELLKLKEFDDKEFIVVDVVDGRGAFEGQGVLVLALDVKSEKATFEAVPATTVENRIHIFNNKKRVIGKRVTVKFFGRTEAGVPRIATVHGDSVMKLF